MKEHNIVKAAHGSSGASDLNTRGAGGLMSAKKKKSTVAPSHKIYLLLFGFVVSFSSLALEIPDQLYRPTMYTFSNDTSTTPSGGLTPVQRVKREDLLSVYMANVVGVVFIPAKGRIQNPSPINNSWTNATKTSSYPVQGEDDRSYYALASVCPDFFPLYGTLAALYVDGFRSSGYSRFLEISSSSWRINITAQKVIADAITSTNISWRSSVIQCLSEINSSIQGISTGIQNINVDLGQFQSDYSSVNQLALNPSSFSYNDMPTMNGSSSFAYEASSVLSDPYLSPAFKSQFAANLGRVYGDYLSKAAQVYSLDQGDPNSPSYGKSFSDFLADSAGVSKSMQYQYSTPLTNGMQRMTTDWKNAVTNDLAKNTASITNRLAQNTASITNQLAQWRRDLHDDLGAVGSDLNSVIISGDERPDGKSALRVDANVNIGELNIAGDIHIDPTQVETLTEGFGDEVSAAVHDWILEWRDWAYDNPDSWSEFYRRFYSEYGPDVITNQLLQISLLTGITNELHTAAWTNDLVSIISNGVAGLNLSITNELWDYYFDRFKKSNEFKDDSGAPFSLDLFRQQVFGGGFDESKYRQLDWFSRVELLLYQIGYASTNDTPEVADLEGQFDDMEEELSTANSDFVAASVKVVSVFALVRRFANSVALAFQSSAAPSTGGIVLLNGGSWLVNEPLVLKVPIQVQNAMRLVFQCIWYLSAFVIAWRILMIAWGRIVAIVRWLWSVFDV